MLLVPKAIVPVNPVIVRFEQVATPAPMVTVLAPEAASKNTVSLVVGTAEPPIPPDVVDHLSRAIPSHEAVPPTQYLFATIKPHLQGLSLA